MDRDPRDQSAGWPVAQRSERAAPGRHPATGGVGPPAPRTAGLPMAQRARPAILDLDGFKGYNDSFGHGAGDALLMRLGHRLAEVANGPARAYRLGGDEFCVLAPTPGL